MRRMLFRYPVTSLVGSNPGNIIELLRIHQAQRKYYLKTALTLLIAAIFSPFNLIERIIYSNRIKNYRFMEPPVFIIGFMRSGTTLLHNLLCRDPKAGFTTTFQTVFPHCVLTQQWWLKPFTNRFLPSQRPFDHVTMDMDFPQEEEFALTNLQSHSIYNFFLFPAEFDNIISHDYFTGSFSLSSLKRWKKEYVRLIIKSLLNSGGQRYVSKNPCNIPRIILLNELFPGARFIFIYRDPYFVVESLYRFILAIFPGVQLQQTPTDFSRKKVAWFYSVAMKQYFDIRNLPGSPPILEIRMEDFRNDAIGGLRKIYNTFGIEGFENALPVFEKYLTENTSAQHESYEIHEETYHYVNLYASEVVEKLGYKLINGR